MVELLWAAQKQLGGIFLHALPGLLVRWAHWVFILQLKDTSTALVFLPHYKNYILPISETVSVFQSLNSIIYKTHYCLHEVIGVTPPKMYSLNIFIPISSWAFLSNCLAHLGIREGSHKRVKVGRVFTVLFLFSCHEVGHHFPSQVLPEFVLQMR